MRVLVTGASGFLGAHVVHLLLKAGETVFATVRPNSNRWRLEEVAGQVVVDDMDLLDAASVQHIIGTYHPDSVISCAAYGVD